MIIIGIDPGLHITGYSVLKADGRLARVLEAGIIRTKEAKNFEEKLEEIYFETEKIIEQYHPDYIAVEELYSHYVHPKTAIIMGHARGIIFLQAARFGIPVVSYASTKIKKSLTGNGRATKTQMQRMIRIALNIKQELLSADTADAMAAALCHLNNIIGKKK